MHAEMGYIWLTSFYLIGLSLHVHYVVIRRPCVSRFACEHALWEVGSVHGVSLELNGSLALCWHLDSFPS